MGKITFRDMITILLLGFVFMVVAMLPHLNPPATEMNVQPPGNVIAHITWPEGNTDVDLWLYGPGEAAPVGYSNKGGALWNLLRDDLGTYPDATPLNYENAYTRGIVPGEYVINVHCYRCLVTPVPVHVEVSVKKDEMDGTKTPLKIIATTEVELVLPKQELTALRFKLTEDGELVPGSLDHVFKQMRPAGSGVSSDGYQDFRGGPGGRGR